MIFLTIYVLYCASIMNDTDECSITKHLGSVRICTMCESPPHPYWTMCIPRTKLIWPWPCWYISLKDQPRSTGAGILYIGWYIVSMSKVNIYMPYMYNKSNTAKKTDYKLLPALQRLPISILIIDNWYTYTEYITLSSQHCVCAVRI